MNIFSLGKTLLTEQRTTSRLQPLTWHSPSLAPIHPKKTGAISLAVILLVGIYSPPIAFAADLNSHIPPAPAMPKQVHRGACGVKIVTPNLNLSTTPSDLELRAARVFQEPLVPANSQNVAGENSALAKVIKDYKNQANTSNVDAFNQFIQNYPKSRWLPSLELNIAQKRYESGYTSDALRLWKSVWEETKKSKSSEVKVIADEAVSQILILDARLGRTHELESYLSAIRNRPFRGSSDLRIKQAGLGLQFQKNHPERAYKCGPFAINSILNAKNKTKSRNPIVDKCKSTDQGTNLLQVKQLADKVSLSYQFAKRSAEAPIIFPSVVHWKLGHFSAITRKNGDLYQVEDPTFDEKGNQWFKVSVFDKESDGYFLVPAGQLPQGWTAISPEDAKTVWGKGTTGAPTPAKPGSFPKTYGPGSCHLMAKASAFKLEATLNIQDSPVGYTPPVGPKINFDINYNDQEGNQPATFTFPNFGQDWSQNWGAYLTLDGSQNATVRAPGGGYEVYNYLLVDNVTNPYVPDLTSQAVLTLTSVGVYQRSMPDGSMEIYNQPDGTGRIFMTQKVDPQGNSAYIQYDANFRIVSVTDTIGQVSTFSYVSNTVGNSGFYLISAITDPFGRSASFAYDSTNSFLLSITDVIGIVSSFHYDPSSSFINLLTTPYGSTSFATRTYNDGIGNTIVSLKTNYPDGTSSVINSSYGFVTESYYWDREAMMLYPFDYQTRGYPAYSERTQWQTSISYIPQPVADWVLPPLDAQTNYTYAGQGITPDGDHNVPGPINKPITVSRTIGSSTQTYSYQYNALGKTTQSIDPVGRTFKYLYSANNIDLLEKRQTQGTNNDLNGKWIFNNTQHVPNKYIDGSGQTTLYSYNSRGQMLTLTDANGSVWTRNYNPDGFLTQIDGPLPGNSDVTTFTYDGYNRLYSVTDSEGYTRIFSYDNADRITQVTYPDGTSEITIYKNLDAIMRKDRINRWTQNSYDSMDQLSFEIDPLGRKTQYSWCACGSMSSLTDGNGNVTTFSHDLEGRLTTKTYVDTSTVTFVYDTLGRLSLRTDALGQQATYNYNLDNTLNNITYNHSVNSTSNVNYTWDPNYNRLSTVGNGWGTYTYSYNPYITDPFGTPTTGGGMLATVLNSTIPNATTSYFYDALGRTTNRQINGSSNSVTWGYDQMSRVTSETNVLGSFAYHYVDDLTGASKGTTRLSSINYPNGQITNFTWYGTIQDERLQGITNLTPTGATRSQFNYGYDSAGEIVSWPQQNAGISPINYALGYDPAGQLVSSQGSTGTASPAASRSYYNYDAAANRTAAQTSTIQTARIGGTITAGNTLTITINDAALTGGQEVVNYTVVTGDTTSTIATKLAAAITSDVNLQSLGVNASASTSLIKIKSVSPNVTTYTPSTSGGATETITLNVSGNQNQNATIGIIGAGLQTRANDVLSLKVFDVGLTGGVETVSYTVPSNNTSLTTAASGLASAVNADTHLSSLGVTATSASAVLTLKSNSPNLTTYASSVTPTTSAATETLTSSANTVGNTTVTVGGTVTTGDVMSLTVRSNSLSGSSETVAYQIPSGATTTSIATGLAAAINADTKFVSFGLTATSSAAVVTILSSPTYAKATSGGATETITLGTTTNGNTTATIGGTVTAGNTVSLKVSGAGLAATRTETYTVVTGDTLSSIATNLSAVVNADTTLKTLGVRASANGAVITVTYNPINYALYLASSTGGATETVALTMNGNSNQLLSVGGTVTAGDIVSLATQDFGLSGGSESDSYTVVSSDTPTTIATGLTAAINADTKLQALGISATSSAAVVTLVSNSTNITTYKPYTSAAATESLVLGANPNGVQTIAVGGTKTTGNVLTLSVYDAGLSTGVERVSYTVLAADSLTTIATAIAAAVNADTNLQAIGVTATSSSTIVNVKSSSLNATTYTQSVSTGATETLTLAAGTGVTKAQHNELNQLISQSAGGAVNFQGTTNKPVKSATVNSQVVSITSIPPKSPFTTTYTLNATNDQPFNIANFFRGAVQLLVQGFGSAPPVGTEYFVYVSNPNLPYGLETITYTTVTADTYVTIAANISSLMNADLNLQSIGINTTAVSQTVNVKTNFPTYTTSTNTGATETLTVSPTYEGAAQISLTGTVTTGDVLSITTSYPSLTGGQETVSHTVVSTDTLPIIAAALATALNSDSKLQAIDLASSSTTSAVLTSSESFTANPVLANGPSTAVVTAVDGGANSKANSYQISIKGAANQSLTFDLNGNMTSDGTNTYAWDAENRLIQINYPGSGNNSQFSYDSWNQCVQILEYSGSTLSSTKQFVWCSDRRCEARSASGTVTAQYFSSGQTISGTSYYYNIDHLGSIREVTDSSGSVQANYSYDSYGRATKLQGSLTSDFQYAGYYFHAASGLNLTLNRAYNASLSRWLSRDPIGEHGGLNLFGYVHNMPTSLTDPSGLDTADGPPIRCFPECKAYCNRTYAHNKIKMVECLIDCYDKFPPAPDPNHNPNYKPDPGTVVTPPGNAFVPPIFVPIPIPGTPYNWPGVSTPFGPIPLVPVWVPGTPILVPI